MTDQPIRGFYLPEQDDAPQTIDIGGGGIDSGQYAVHLPIRSMGHSPTVEYDDWAERACNRALRPGWSLKFE